MWKVRLINKIKTVNIMHEQKQYFRQGLQIIIFILNLKQFVMKSHPRIIFAQFKAVLKRIANNYPSQSIHFREFLQLLSQNDIRVYSKAEILKMGKFFNNPLKLSRIQIPLSYLQLDNVQKINQKKYFLVKVMPNEVYPKLIEQKDNHDSEQCLIALIKSLKKLFGNQNNWFRALGGQSIAMTIDYLTFKKRVIKILLNTSHYNCTSNIMKIFTEQPHKKDIEWKKFTNIVGKYQVIESQLVDLKNRYSFLQSVAKSLPSKTSNHFYQHRITFESNLNNELRSSHLSSKSKRKKIIKIDIPTQQSQEKQFNNIFLLSSKSKPYQNLECQIYNKNSSQKSPKVKTTRQIKSSSNRRFFHCKAKTQQNQNPVNPLHQTDTSLKNSKNRLENDSTIQFNNSILSPIIGDAQINKKIEKDPEIESYVVVVQNQTGIQIQI